MALTSKNLMLMNEIVSELKLRSALTLTPGFSATDGSPTLVIGGPAGSDGAFLKITTQPTINSDVVGNAQQVYSQNIAQLGVEANFAGTTDNVADVVTKQTLANLLGMLATRGLTTELYESASGTFPTESTLVAGNKKATFATSAKWGVLAAS